MSDQNPKELNEERRKLLIATGGVGALGAAAFVTPMVASFAPSVKAKASGAPVEVDISALKPGEQINKVKLTKALQTKLTQVSD